jgi:hypothetical protein
VEPANGDLVHVIFPLEVVDDGWPPVDSERMWASVVGADLYRLDNSPWFATGVAEGEWPFFVEVAEWSGNCTIRIIPLKDGELMGDQGRVLDLFTALGVTGEGAGSVRSLP